MSAALQILGHWWTHLPMTQSEIWGLHPRMLMTEVGYTPACMTTKSPWAITICQVNGNELLYRRRRWHLKKTPSQ